MEIIRIAGPDEIEETAVEGLGLKLGPTQICVKLRDKGRNAKARGRCVRPERLGVVLEVGRRVRTLEPGDGAICIGPADPAPRNDPGSEYVADEERHWLRLPKELLDLAALVEPLAIAEKALAEICSMQDRFPHAWTGALDEGSASPHRALVLGDDAGGVLAAMALVAGGFETFVLADGDGAAPAVEEFGAKPWRPDRDGASETFDLLYDAGADSRTTLGLLGRLSADGVFISGGRGEWLDGPAAEIGRALTDLLRGGRIAFGAVRPSITSYEDAIRDLWIFQGRWPESVRAVAGALAAAESKADISVADAV